MDIKTSRGERYEAGMFEGYGGWLVWPMLVLSLPLMLLFMLEMLVFRMGDQ